MTPDPFRPAVGFVMSPKAFGIVYPDSVYDRIALHATIRVPPCDAGIFLGQDDSVLEGLAYLFTGWGAPQLDAALLNRLPNLRGVFHAAGTIKPIVSDAFWEQGLFITSSNGINALPVGQFCLAQIILALKGVPAMQRALSDDRHFPAAHDFRFPGNHRTTVGLISLGATARELVALCRQSCNYRLLGFDPLLEDKDFTHLGVERASLDDVFEQSDAVSLHTPLLPETVDMIREEHFLRMKPHATFLNTARGAIVDTEGLLRAAHKRPDIQFLLDVCHPEPLPPDHALFDRPNVFITPHLAGALGAEAGMLGEAMAEEFERCLEGRPLKNAWTAEELARKA